MAKRLFVCFSLFLINLFPDSTDAQVSRKVLRQFPAHIVNHIHELIKVVPVSEVSQLKLGYYLLLRDSLANQILKQCDSSSVLVPYYTLNTEELHDLLSPLEFNSYRLTEFSSGKVSVLRKFIKEREVLGLNDLQVKKLLEASDKVEYRLQDTGFNRQVTEHQLADQILTSEVHLLYYRCKNKTPAYRQASEDYAGIKAFGFIPSQGDSAEIFRQLYDFELQRLSVSEYRKNSGDEVKYKTTLSSLKNKQPEILSRWKSCRAIPWWSNMNGVVKYHQELYLTPGEIDAVVLACQEMQRTAAQYKQNETWFNRQQFEYKQLFALLGKERLNNYFRLIRIEPAFQKAKKQIEEIEKYHLITSDAEYVKTLEEVFDYELRLQIANEWLIMEKSREYVIHKKNIEDNRPKVLGQLEEQKKKIKENTIRF